MSKKDPKKSKGQAMLEFALVLPLLLMVVYGLIEVGRAVFIYSSVTNASREASRYGSAYGFIPGETPPVHGRFQDCAGMRNAARSAGYLLSLADEDIEIEYDTGPYLDITDNDSDGDTEEYLVDTIAVCEVDDTLKSDLLLECGERITVRVTEYYSPILSIIPISPKEIRSESSRTYTGIIKLDPEFDCYTEPE